MQIDFHYYAAYCAAVLAGFSHEESMSICYADQFTDHCTKTFLAQVKGPESAATTQTQMELMKARTDIFGLQDMTRIWASFHFLPFDLSAPRKKGTTRLYMNKYRLICNPNGVLVKEMVEKAKGKDLQAIGVAMHVLSDTWAHRYFAGTPSLVINNTDYYFYELVEENGKEIEKPVVLKHNPTAKDNTETQKYTGSIFQGDEDSIMNLGHGRAGHLPDYSYAKYKYLPAWGDYEEIVKDNPADYYNAFCQMIYALRYLRGEEGECFELNRYSFDTAEPYKERIMSIIRKRQTVASEDWKEFGQSLIGCAIEDFDINKYVREYVSAPESDKAKTYLGKFFLAAIEHKSMVANRIFSSGSLLAGVSKDYLSMSRRSRARINRLLKKMGLEERAQ